MKHIVLSAVAALVMLACAPQDNASAGPETPAASGDPGSELQLPVEDACNAAQYANLVGRPADMPGVPEASPLVRHIRPDTQVTMDYRPERLNIEISDQGVITGFRCG